MGNHPAKSSGDVLCLTPEEVKLNQPDKFVVLPCHVRLLPLKEEEEENQEEGVDDSSKGTDSSGTRPGNANTVEPKKKRTARASRQQWTNTVEVLKRKISSADELAQGKFEHLHIIRLTYLYYTM